MEEILAVGKWLEFDAGTCFGTQKMHFGILVGIDYVRGRAVVAANATSKIENLIRFADLHGIPVADAMVDVTEDVHFTKPTGIDCHRPKKIKLSQMETWVAQSKIRKTSYNEDVPAAKMQRLTEIMLDSPLIAESTKIIIRGNGYAPPASHP